MNVIMCIKEVRNMTDCLVIRSKLMQWIYIHSVHSHHSLLEKQVSPYLALFITTHKHSHLKTIY